VSNAEKYRTEAARLRREAESAKHPDIQRQLLQIAQQYEQLATTIDAQGQKRSS
jgi:hypothetical protein